MRGVVNLWSLDLPAGGVTADQLELAQRLIVESALSLLQAIVEPQQAWLATPRLWLVTRNVVAASPDDNSPPDPASAVLWGFGRSAALEHPQAWGGLLDLGAEAPPSEEAARLLGEILHGDGEDQIALARGLAGSPLGWSGRQPPAKTRANPDSEGTYLITGGLGALGVETAKWLVSSRGVKHLVLASRRGARGPERQPGRGRALGAWRGRQNCRRRHHEGSRRPATVGGRQIASGAQGDLSLRRPFGRRHPAPDELGEVLAGHGAEGDWRLVAQRIVARLQVSNVSWCFRRF